MEDPVPERIIAELSQKPCTSAESCKGGTDVCRRTADLRREGGNLIKGAAAAVGDKVNQRLADRC